MSPKRGKTRNFREAARDLACTRSNHATAPATALGQGCAARPRRARSTTSSRGTTASKSDIFATIAAPRAPWTRDVQRDSRRADNQITVAWSIWAAEGGTDMALLTFWKRSGSSVSLLWWHACAQTNAQWAQATERCSWRHASQGPPPDPVQCAVQAKAGLRACRQRTRAWSAMVCDWGHTLSN